MDGPVLGNTHNDRAFHVGEFDRPKLGELQESVRLCRENAESKHLEGTIRLMNVIADSAADLQSDPRYKGSTFQVASQMNCLEFPDPQTVPEDGVRDYQLDKSQGPCCSISAGPATIFRNYLVPNGSGCAKCIPTGSIPHVGASPAGVG